MHVAVEAKTGRGVRRFLVSGNSSSEGVAWLRALVDRRVRITDEHGEHFESSSLDVNTIEPSTGVAERRSAASRFATNGQKVE